MREMKATIRPLILEKALHALAGLALVETDRETVGRFPSPRRMDGETLMLIAVGGPLAEVARVRPAGTQMFPRARRSRRPSRQPPNAGACGEAGRSCHHTGAEVAATRRGRRS